MAKQSKRKSDNTPIPAPTSASEPALNLPDDPKNLRAPEDAGMEQEIRLSMEAYMKERDPVKYWKEMVAKIAAAPPNDDPVVQERFIRTELTETVAKFAWQHMVGWRDAQLAALSYPPELLADLVSPQGDPEAQVKRISAWLCNMVNVGHWIEAYAHQRIRIAMADAADIGRWPGKKDLDQLFENERYRIESRLFAAIGGAQFKGVWPESTAEHAFPLYRTLVTPDDSADE